MAVAIVAALLGAGCGGSDDADDAGSGNNEPRKPDTGYGAGQTVPNPRSCTEFCERMGDCIVSLCGEDDMTDIYEELREIMTRSCSLSCTDSILSEMSTSEWQCYFQSSCRQVFDYDGCKLGGNYYCNM